MQLSKMQGKGEKHNKMYKSVHRMSIAAFDAAVCQEQERSFWLRRKVGSP